jgi:hypothetical protein
MAPGDVPEPPSALDSLKIIVQTLQVAKNSKGKQEDERGVVILSPKQKTS